jgi:hypothetical protein
VRFRVSAGTCAAGVTSLDWNGRSFDQRRSYGLAVVEGREDWVAAQEEAVLGVWGQEGEVLQQGVSFRAFGAFSWPSFNPFRQIAVTPEVHCWSSLELGDEPVRARIRAGKPHERTPQPSSGHEGTPRLQRNSSP